MSKQIEVQICQDINREIKSFFLVPKEQITFGCFSHCDIWSPANVTSPSALAPVLATIVCTEDNKIQFHNTSNTDISMVVTIKPGSGSIPPTSAIKVLAPSCAVLLADNFQYHVSIMGVSYNIILPTIITRINYAWEAKKILGLLLHNRYRLESVLGETKGHNYVYRAIDITNNQVVAVKILTKMKLDVSYPAINGAWCIILITLILNILCDILV